MKHATFVIVGGGIAGVSCSEALDIFAPDESVLLISESSTVKTVTNVRKLTNMLTQFDVEEKSVEEVQVSVVQGKVLNINHEEKFIETNSGETISYEKLCICTGGSPKLISSNKHVIGIRDTDSVVELQKRLESARRMVVVGNGGIATELVHKTKGIEIFWVVKDKHISATFVDPGAAEFFQEKLINEDKSVSDEPVKRMRYTVDGSGAALGPDWHSKVNLKGLLEKRQVSVEYYCEVKEIIEGDKDWPVYVLLTNDKKIGCDFIVSATGVHPNVISDKFYTAEDGGIKVNWKMETNLIDVYAAGDVCTAAWDYAPHWFQMRLWTQARQMGLYAAKAMVCSIKGEELIQDFCFELFTHVTSFFGMKVVLLGLFNGQTLDNKYEILLRVTKNKEYIKLILKDGRMQGAVIIGETELEEMCENLILNQLDLTNVSDNLLNPDIEIDDYFD